MAKNSGVGKHWWYILLIIVMAFTVYGSKDLIDTLDIDFESFQTENTDVWCASYKHIRMEDDQRRMVVTAKPDCWNGWITVPTTTDQFWIFPEKGSTVEIQFIDGKYVLDHPDRGPIWVGQSTGVFRLRAIDKPAEVTITIRPL